MQPHQTTIGPVSQGLQPVRVLVYTAISLKGNGPSTKYVEQRPLMSGDRAETRLAWRLVPGGGFASN